MKLIRFIHPLENIINTIGIVLFVSHLASSTITVQPSSGRATLIYGQTLHLECGLVDNDKAEFKWSKRSLYSDESIEEPLEPDNDEVYQIHNERLKLIKPNYDMAGDYICRPLSSDNKSESDQKEFAVIKVRAQPYIEDFGVQMSHTGKSAILTDGERLELICKVEKTYGPVNITWHRSVSADSDSVMVELETSNASKLQGSHGSYQDLGNMSANSIIGPTTFHVPNDHQIIIEEIDSHTKRLVIGSVKQDHRGFYTCLANNGVTERTKRVVYLRVKDKLAALWPFLGIVAEIFILLTIIQIWETRRAYKEVNSPSVQTPKRPPPGVVVPSEIVPLTSG